MANWLIAGSERWLTPLYDYMHAELLMRDIVQADETTLQVLREPERAAQTKSYLWLYRTGRVGPDMILYDYQPGRDGKHPEAFLAGFKGYLQTDGYSGYIQQGKERHAARLLEPCAQILS